MAASAQSLTRRASPNSALISLINATIKTLNPQNPNPSKTDLTTLHQFASQLDSELVIEVIKQQTNPNHGLFFFNFVSSLNPNPNNFSPNHTCYVSITDLLLSHSRFSEAFDLLEKYKRLSDLTLSKFITAHGNRGDFGSSMECFDKAKRILKGKCLFCYNAALGTLVKSNRIDLAKSVFDEVVNGSLVKPDVSTYTTMIRGFCKVGLVEDAKKVFDEMNLEPNLVTFNVLIDGYCKKRDLVNARLVFGRMKLSSGCLPNIVTFTTLIDAYCKRGEFDEAMRLMSDMEGCGCKPNALTYNALINGFCLVGKVEEGKRLVTKMRLHGLRDNAATSTSILKGLSVAGKSDEVIEYFKEMVRKGMELQRKAYVIVIGAFCSLGEPDEAMLLINKLRDRGISLDVSSFNKVLSSFIEFKKLDAAIHVLKDMKRLGCRPNFMSYNIVISGLSRDRSRMQEIGEIAQTANQGLIVDNREVELLVKRMLRDGFDLDTSMYSCLVKGYSEAGNEEKAMKFFNESVCKNYVVKLEAFTTLVKLLCGKGKFVEAEKIFDDMCWRCSLVDANSYRKVLDNQLLEHSKKKSCTK